MVFNKNKGGQAAIEFLMTYGWMLLVVLIVGALIFSFVDFGSLLPNKIELNNIEFIKEYGADSRKIGADLYIDDKGISGIPMINGDEVDWKTIYEVVHEKYHRAIIEACHKYKTDVAVQGLLFNYKHFFGTYDYVGDSRKWYAHEVRIIRNNKKITAYRDAQGFRIGKTKLPVANINASIYHYGWVKSPEQMRKKQKESSVFWHDDTQMEKIISSPDYYDFSGFDSLEKFTDTHPIVMKERIIRKNWAIDLDISKKKFSLKNLILYYFEKWTGIRPFDFRNYKVIRK